MFFGCISSNNLSNDGNTEPPLLSFICIRTRCSAVSPSESSASKFAPNVYTPFDAVGVTVSTINKRLPMLVCGLPSLCGIYYTVSHKKDPRHFLM